MNGTEKLAEAERRVVDWLRRHLGIELESGDTARAGNLVNEVIDALNDGDQHVMILTATGWLLEHDLRCHIGVGGGCGYERPIRDWLNDIGRPDHPPGRYRVRVDGNLRRLPHPVYLEPLDPPHHTG